MAIKTALLSVGGTVAILGLMSGPALAGGPSNCVSTGCDTGVAYMPTPTGYSGPTTVENRTPYDFLDSVHFQRSPHVSITRVHSLPVTVGLADSPGGFTQGCHPESTTYCRSGHGSSGGTVTSAPVMSTPALSAPVVSSGFATRPAQTYVQPSPVGPSRVVAVGGGFDPSKFTPRIYGDPYTITPGIAYLPTSIVDRNPYRAQAVLDAGPGGITPALTGMPIGPLPTPRPYSMASAQTAMMAPRPPVMTRPAMQAPMMQAPMAQPRMMPRPMMHAPMVQQQMIQRPMAQRPMMRAPMMPRQMVQPSIPTGYPGAAGAPYQMSDGRYGSTVGADGTYWEKVSGPTQFGNTVASQVICKRRLPHPTPTPYPAPQPMPPTTCNTQSGHQGGHPSRY